ncbi:hypothetical protein EDD53_0682 [Pacificibacter maritimus]|uniref:TrgA family protein n=1 Tax=Pacificibacter maritimus TaxID=762213 RepID=A0A3N4UVP1_9RHOB|nr:TrgA family protein [Pacificibacter maritimus]RPE71561.1 hypothetical protein EDD53_0682 [Pacificibacter maritimus]
MPTAPKLVAALWFAALAWFCAGMVTRYLPEGTQLGHFALISAGFGGLVGWTFLGRRAGDTMRAALGYGLTAVALTVFYCLFYFSAEKMVQRSLNNRYDGPMDAVVSVVELMGEYLILVAKIDVILVLLIGGLFGGWLVEKVGRKWS